MKRLAQGRMRFALAAIALLLVAGTGVAVAAATSAPPSNARSTGRGIHEFGLTSAFFAGKTDTFRYTKGFFCDTNVYSSASSKCEAGRRAKVPPNGKDFDPLYITVPLGFSEPMKSMECPTGLVCVDHPGTIDLRRLEPALKPLYPHLTKAQLTAALANYRVPGHNHFITTRNGGAAEWWDVRIVGVTNKAEYDKISNHKSAAFLFHEVHAGKTTGVIRTNLFLYFAVR